MPLPCISVDDDLQLCNSTESPIDNEILPDTDSHILPTWNTDASPLPMNKILPHEPSEPLPESPIVDKALPTTNVRHLPISLPSHHSTRRKNKPPN